MLEQMIQDLLVNPNRKLQYIYTLEECSELIKEITKDIRGKGDIEHMKEECIDVILTTYMLLLDKCPDITIDNITDTMIWKCRRALQRLKENGFD